MEVWGNLEMGSAKPGSLFVFYRYDETLQPKATSGAKGLFHEAKSGSTVEAENKAKAIARC